MTDQKKIASYLDATMLKPTATREDIKKLCTEAIQYGYAAVCINPFHVQYAAKLLAGSKIGIATVAGFPLGANTVKIKMLEAREAIANGATEIDMVMNIGALKERQIDYITKEIRLVKHNIGDKILKVIIETGLLTPEEKRLATLAVKEAGADMIKTSTGFAGGATIEDVLLIKETAPGLKIKASGGIRDFNTAQEFIALGVERIGTSSARAIVEQAQP
ncbi:MAG TPA: deoxyribose-phosphate aldolase [Firmicutes bacterium]|nr:deoxyribose-phosphate aldolase [Bacillota bacterium]